MQLIQYFTTKHLSMAAPSCSGRTLISYQVVCSKQAVSAATDCAMALISAKCFFKNINTPLPRRASTPCGVRRLRFCCADILRAYMVLPKALGAGMSKTRPPSCSQSCKRWQQEFSGNQARGADNKQQGNRDNRISYRQRDLYRRNGLHRASTRGRLTVSRRRIQRAYFCRIRCQLRVLRLVVER